MEGAYNSLLRQTPLDGLNLPTHPLLDHDPQKITNFFLTNIQEPGRRGFTVHSPSFLEESIKTEKAKWEHKLTPVATTKSILGVTFFAGAVALISYVAYPIIFHNKWEINETMDLIYVALTIISIGSLLSGLAKICPFTDCYFASLGRSKAKDKISNLGGRLECSNLQREVDQQIETASKINNNYKDYVTFVKQMVGDVEGSLNKESTVQDRAQGYLNYLQNTCNGENNRYTDKVFQDNLIEVYQALMDDPTTAKVDTAVPQLLGPRISFSQWLFEKWDHSMNSIPKN